MVGATAVVVVSSSGCGGESVMVVAPASPPPQPRRRSPRAGLGQRLRESVLSPSGLRRRDSLALLKQQPLVASLLVAGRRVTRSRSVSKVGLCCPPAPLPAYCLSACLPCLLTCPYFP